MMKRKMMAAVLTMAMAATMIGGCGNSTDTSNAGNSTNTTESSADAADSAKDTAQNTLIMQITPIMVRQIPLP